MAKVDSTIKNETKGIAIVVLILSALMQAIYLFIRHWNYTVLLGNILGGGAGILNFFLMCLSLQKALNKDAKEAGATARVSQTYRNLMLIGILAVAYFAPCFDIIPTIISLFFATLGVYSKAFTMKKDTSNTAQEVAEE